jgi:hypothetical protein
MTDVDLDRYGAELHRRVDMLIETLQGLPAAEASGDPVAISSAEEAAWQARLALAEIALGDMARVRMLREIEPLDNQGDDPATNHRRRLIMLARILTDTRPFGFADVTDVAVADMFRQVNGVQGQLLRPVNPGPGTRRYDAIDWDLIRRYVLLARVECARTGKAHPDFLASQPLGPSHPQFRDWSRHVAREELAMAEKIGKAQHDGRSLSTDHAALWEEIKRDNLVELYGYVMRLDPEKVRSVS